MRRALVALIGFLLLAACPVLAQEDPHLISPGVGIGPLKIGTSITDAVSVMGTPKVTGEGHYPEGERILYAWFNYTNLSSGKTQLAASTDPNAAGGLYVHCAPSGQIEEVFAYFAPQYATANGLHTGLTEQQARIIMGEPLKIMNGRFPSGRGWHSLVYDSQGILFQVLDWSGAVYLIEVFAPRK